MRGASGVWGGDDQFVTESGEFWLRRWRRDPEHRRLMEKRYRLALPSEAREQLARAVVSSEFFRLRNPKRKWIPDEPRVLIGVFRCGSGWASIERSPFDTERRFRIVYDWFQAQTRAAEETRA